MNSKRMDLIRVAIPFVLVLTLLGALPARAFEPNRDYWFVETLTPGDVELPEGVTIRDSDPTAGPRATLTLENQTDTLLFVLSLNYKDVLVMQTPDPNWKARLGMAHEVASFLVAKEKPATLTMEALADLDSRLVDRNVLSIDPPPADVALPAPQSSELLLVYGEQVLLVPFTLSYTLNGQFSNGSQANANQVVNAQATGSVGAMATYQAGAVNTRGVRNNALAIGLGGAAALLIIGWLVWRGMVRRG